MIFYESGKWGFSLAYGYSGSSFPRALTMAIPNAILAYLITQQHGEFTDTSQAQAKASKDIMGFFSSVLTFVLYRRAKNAYSRWWEGGTLLQQVRGEWFNAYSSLIAFVSADPKRIEEVAAFQHLLARLMSLMFCTALQQVSPDREREFEIISCKGVDQQSLDFLKSSSDKIEVILQWVQRSTIQNMKTGVIPTPPPVVSRAFQELSRGIVNVQNARKIADFPYPFPYAQVIIVMMIIHWACCPILASIMLNSKIWAALTCFVVTWFMWCLHFIALDLESPFGNEDNDLPMNQMQCDWNKSIATLLNAGCSQPPTFTFDPDKHRKFELTMSSG